jgi:YidC/Oxa1 family membrane protein insertase
MGTLMGWVYTAISQIMLAWHGLWDLIFPNAALLATNWQWILAIVFLVVTVRAIMFPIFVKQIKSQRAMQAIQPKMAELREKHKGDRETLNREMTELMRKENANPLMGCLPMFLQIPVFLGLLHVLRHLARPGSHDDPFKTLYGWTVGAFDSAAKAKFFGAPIAADIKTNSAILDTLNASGWLTKLMVVLLTLAMAGTSYLTSRQMIRKTGPATDPQQKMMQNLMLYFIPASALFTGLVYGFPIGVILYWVVNNVLSLGQQHWVMKKYPLPAAATAGAAGAGKVGAPAKPGKPAASEGKGLFSRLTASLNQARDAAATKGAAPAKDTTGSNGSDQAAKTGSAKTGSAKTGPGKPGSAKSGSDKPGSNKPGTTANGSGKGGPPAATDGKGTTTKAGGGAKGGGKASGSTPTPKAAAPRPGAKPTYPKKGPAKRTNK